MPTLDALADTLDEDEPPRETTRPGHERTPNGCFRSRSGSFKPIGVPDREPYYDAAPDEPDAPVNVDLDARVTALESAMPSHAMNAKLVGWGIKIGGGLLGLGTAIFLWVLAAADAKGEARATARARESQRLEDHGLLLELRTIVGEIRGELRARNPIGMVPRLGPPPAPQQDQDHKP